jgi:putative YphP/YqiW family bacilliredoxin
MQPPMYPEEFVTPMRQELTAVGFQELRTPEEVDRAVAAPGTTLCVINSICGCAGGTARPAVALALQHRVIPDRLVTVFAGMERDAVERVRQYHRDAAPPSSPSMVLFKDGKVVAMVQRSDIEGRTAQEVAGRLVAEFGEACARPGPSIPPEEYAKLKHLHACGSGIPRMQR